MEERKADIAKANGGDKAQKAKEGKGWGVGDEKREGKGRNKEGWGRRRKCWEDYESQQPAVEVSEGIRKLVNVSIVSGHNYSEWKEEVLCTIPKVQGSTFIGDTRPIGLLVILRNVTMGIIYRRVREVWERCGVISATQLGCQRGPFPQ